MRALTAPGGAQQEALVLAREHAGERGEVFLKLGQALQVPPVFADRKEEKLLDEKQLNASRILRRHLLNMPPAQAMKSLLDVLSKHKTNQSVFESIRT